MKSDSPIRKPKRRGHSARFKMAALMPLRKWLRDPKSVVIDGREFSRLSDLIECVAAQLQVSSRSLWRWHRRFETSGFQGLSKARRSDKGASHFFAKHLYAAIFVHREWARGVSVPRIHAELQRQMLKPPNYKTVRAYVHSIIRSTMRPQ